MLSKHGNNCIKTFKKRQIDDEKSELTVERLTVQLGLTVIYFPIFHQARPDFSRLCLQLRKDVTI